VVSTYALGTMTFGAETDEPGSFAQMDAFVEAGGTLLDTADVYSAGESESIIGRWLSQRPRDITERVVLATKGRFSMGPDANDAGLSRRHLRRALRASMRRLGVEHVDLYQVHAWDPLTPLEETVAAIGDEIRAGLVSYWGLSNYTGWQLAAACATADVLSVPRPVTLQPQYNLLAREIEWEVVPAAEYHGLGLLPWSPLGGGWLTGKYRRDSPPQGATRLGENPTRGVEAYEKRSARQRTWDVLDALSAIAEENGSSMGATALAWLQSRPAMTSVILGARTLEQLRANLDAVTVTLTADQVARLDEASDPSPADYPYGTAGADQRSRVLPGG
jgi:aryl-alcohol dehydrogenase-like predicted oxidoreductase